MDEEIDDFADPLFKGCTRPPMLWGVPLEPLFFVIGVTLLFAFWTTMLIVPLALPVIFIMKMIAKKDDQQFRLLRMKIMFRIGFLNRNGSFWNASTWTPVNFEQRHNKRRR